MENNNAKVLIIEDDEETARMIEVILNLEGYKTSTLRHGVKIEESIKEIQPDIIILDIMLPVIDGIEILKELKDNPETQDIPVIVCSVKFTGSDQELAFRSGAQDYVTKPFNPEDLVNAVKCALQGKK